MLDDISDFAIQRPFRKWKFKDVSIKQSAIAKWKNVDIRSAKLIRYHASLKFACFYFMKP